MSRGTLCTANSEMYMGLVRPRVVLGWVGCVGSKVLYLYTDQIIAGKLRFPCNREEFAHQFSCKVHSYVMTFIDDVTSDVT